MKEPKMISKISIKDDINEDSGFGEVLIGMNIYYFKQIFNESKQYNSKNKKDWNLYTSEGLLHFVHLDYKNYFRLDFNIVIGKLSSITYKLGYKGKLWSKVKPGIKFKKLLKYSPYEEYEIYDGILVFKEQTNILFNIESDFYGDDNPEYSEIKNKVIIEITIRNRELGHYNNQYGDIPELWAKSKPNEIGLKN